MQGKIDVASDFYNLTFYSFFVHGFAFKQFMNITYWKLVHLMS